VFDSSGVPKFVGCGSTNTSTCTKWTRTGTNSWSSTSYTIDYYENNSHIGQGHYRLKSTWAEVSGSVHPTTYLHGLTYVTHGSVAEGTTYDYWWTNSPSTDYTTDGLSSGYGFARQMTSFTNFNRLPYYTLSQTTSGTRQHLWGEKDNYDGDDAIIYKTRLYFSDGSTVTTAVDGGADEIRNFRYLTRLDNHAPHGDYIPSSGGAFIFVQEDFSGSYARSLRYYGSPTLTLSTTCN
jgi:hypothetical protein